MLNSGFPLLETVYLGAYICTPKVTNVFSNTNGHRLSVVRPLVAWRHSRGFVVVFVLCHPPNPSLFQKAVWLHSNSVLSNLYLILLNDHQLGHLIISDVCISLISYHTCAILKDFRNKGHCINLTYHVASFLRTSYFNIFCRF